MTRNMLLKSIGAAIFGWLSPVGSARLYGRRYVVPPTLWYENENGEKWIPDEEHFRRMTDPPAGFIYQHSQFPRQLECSICEGGRGRLASFRTTWPEDLVFAMAHDGYRLSEAILIAANMCGRCLNAAGSDYRLTWGYPRYSQEWHRTNTVCEFCRDVKP